MRKHLAVWGLVTMVAVCGCQSRSAEEPESFDPKVDSTSSGGGRLDPMLLADQEQIAQASPSRVKVAAVPADPVEAVKDVLARMIEAEKTKDFQKFLEFLIPDEAKVLQPVAAKAKEITEKEASVTQLVKERLELDFSLAAGGASAGGVGSFVKTGSADAMDIEKMKFEPAEGQVTVTGPNGQKFAFVRVGDDWKLKMGLEASMLPVMMEFLDAVVAYLGDVEAGVNDGSVTKENFAAKCQELSAARLAPAMGKITQLAAQEKAKLAGKSAGVAGGTAQIDISTDFPLDTAKPADKQVIAEVRTFIETLATATEEKQYDQAVGMYEAKDAPLIRSAIRGNWMARRTRSAIEAATKKAQDKKIDFMAAGAAIDASYDVSARDAILAAVVPPLVELKPYAAPEATFQSAGDLVLVSTPSGGRMLLARNEGQWARRLLSHERKGLTALRGLYAAADKCWQELAAALDGGSIATQEDLIAKAAELAGQRISPAGKDLASIAAAMPVPIISEGAVLPVPPGAEAAPGEPAAVQPAPIQPVEALPADSNAPAAEKPDKAGNLQQQNQQDRGPEKAQEMRERLMRPTKRLTGGGY